MDALILRGAKPGDFRATEELTRAAFWNRYAPGCVEHYLLNILRGAPAFIPALDLVAELDGRVAGSIVYTKAQILPAGGCPYDVICFGPVAVRPECQNKGVGAALIRHSLARARALGHRAVFIYGDPGYYARFGFVAAEGYGIGSADGMYADALQALELVPGALAGIAGRFVEDAVFEIDEAAAQAFDEGFPPWELRADTPSQQKFRALASLRRPMA